MLTEQPQGHQFVCRDLEEKEIINIYLTSAPSSGMGLPLVGLPRRKIFTHCPFLGTKFTDVNPKGNKKQKRKWHRILI